MKVVDRVCAPAFVGTMVLMKTHDGLLALAAARVTLPLNPPMSVTVMVLVPPAPPWVIVTLLGEAESVKLGVADPARALIRFCPFGLPTSDQCHNR